MLSEILAASLLTLTSLVYLYYRWCFRYWKNRGVYTLTPSIPFGNGANKILSRTCFALDLKDYYFILKNKGLRYGGLYFGTSPLFFVTDLDLIKDMLTTNFQHFTDHPFFVDEKSDPLSGHLLFLKGEKWKKFRAKLSPSFTSSKIKMMFENIRKCARGLEDLIEETIAKNEIFNARDAMNRFTTDVIGSCGFGIEINSLKNPNNEFRKHGDQIFTPSFKREFFISIATYVPKLMNYLIINLHDKGQINFFFNTTKETVEYREKHNYVRKDFLQQLIQLKKADNEVTMADIASNIYVFFLAGYETSATTTTFLLYELAANKNIQGKVREEVRYVLDKYNGEITYEALMEMAYLDKCVQETLRKYPAFPILNRICTKTYKVPESDLVIEKGTVVLICLFGIQSDPEYYPDPQVFDPERFSEEAKSTRDNFTWLPFGEGPRICIGLKLGVIQIKMAIASLIRSYKFSVNSKTQIPMKFNEKGFSLTAKGGIWLNAEKC
ncbi:probable cytochrome P450 6a21 [Agrilus planipennis]|uniref:Probable cytochrome P450 6a21 n=1 Tax=Agrilus planipennis TaxID=224129 RepID=A0A1W4WCG5_AGRPL|nr:probable cytochrome P450 6a21 [Agrilus planipennis]